MKLLRLPLFLIGVMVLQLSPVAIAQTPAHPCSQAGSTARARAVDCVNQGIRFRGQNQPDEAIAAYQEAIQQDGNYGPAYYNLGVVLMDLDRLDEAIAVLRIATQLDPDLAPAFQFLGNALRQRNRPEYTAAYDRAIQIYRRTGSAAAYTDLTRLLIDLERDDEAVEAGRMAVQLNPDLPPAQNALGNALLNRARQLATAGNTTDAQAVREEAVVAYQNAIAAFERVPATPMRNIATAYENLGTALDALGRRDEAVQAYNRANALRNPDATSLTTAMDYVNYGRRLRDQGQRQEAIAQYTQAITLDPTLAIAYNNRGVALAELGQIDAAIQDYQTAIRLAPTVIQYINLGNAYAAQGKITEAIAAYRQIEKVLETLETLPAPVDNQDFLAAILLNQRGYELYRDLATSLTRNLDYYAFYIDLLMQLHKREPAAGYNVQALLITERARARTLMEMLTTADAYERIGDRQLAAQEQELRRQFLALQERWNQLTNNPLNINRVRPQPAEPAVLPTPGDSAVAPPLLSTAPASDPAILSDPGMTTEPFPPSEPAIPAPPSIDQQQAAIQQTIQQLLEQYRQLQQKIRTENPDYANITQAPRLSLQDIQQQVIGDRDTVLLEYWLGKEKSYLWVVTATTVQSYELPKQADIEAAARRFYGFMTIPSERLKTVRSAGAGLTLSQMILGPIAAQLREQRLLVVADGALQYIPFSALPIPRVDGTTTVDPNALPNPLMTAHEVVSLPSASSLALIRRQQARTTAETVAVVADPVFNQDDERLPESERQAAPSTNAGGSQRAAQSSIEKQYFPRLPGTGVEAEEIVDLAQDEGFRPLPVVGFNANRAEIFSEPFSNNRIIHFATHGLLNDLHPERSGLLLSRFDAQGSAQEQNGFLSMTDVFQLSLNTDLVVLSGCRTGLGAEVRGEGLLGLTRGFMYAGAKTVVASLWSVDDAATAELMSEFYRELLDRGRSPAEALRRAQIHMLEIPEWRNPYYWAAFTLQGEWR